MTDKIKSGVELLDEYFANLKADPSIDEKLKNTLCDLWSKKQLYTKTSLVRALEELRRNETV